MTPVNRAFSVETVAGWGQRVAPPFRTFIRETEGIWNVVHEGSGFGEDERVGIYLGNGLVLVVPPQDAECS